MATSKSSKQKVSFAILDPEAQSVALVGDFTEWEADAVQLKKQKNGQWKATVPLAPGSYEYRFLVDGQWRDDPQCQERLPNSFGSQNCVRVVQ